MMYDFHRYRLPPPSILAFVRYYEDQVHTARGLYLTLRFAGSQLLLEVIGRKRRFVLLTHLVGGILYNWSLRPASS